VYASITGFGSSGPQRDAPGYDFTIQAQGGVMSITGEPGAEPQKVGVAIADITAGLHAAIAILVAAIIWLVGMGPFLVVQLPITLLAASIGVWLFYVQHQFEHTTWANDQEWSLHEAALHGSSHYDLPFPLRWITGNIGIHHVHHLSATVPFYRLPEVLRDHPELRDTGRITLLQSLRCIRLVLWDETAQRLVSFREARATC